MNSIKFVNNTTFSILNNIIQLIVSLGSGMIIARVLGPEGKGIFFLITQIVSIGVISLGLGFAPSILFFLKQKKLTKNEAITISVFILYLLL